jgi:S-adenosylmethionine hydrolase
VAKKIVTLTTDFGLRDPYVAEMKAVILNICPEVDIVDVSHEVAKFDVRMGAYMLASAAPYFSKGTIHVTVIDPGVGTARRGLIVQTKQGFLVGPDNGVLVLAAEKQGIVDVREIVNTKLMLPQVSSTFHGRDMFAPAAAHLANGVSPAEFGEKVQDIVKPEFTKIKSSRNKLTCEVLHVDGFGNIVTNVSGEVFARFKGGEPFGVNINRRKVKVKFVKTYAEAQPKEALILVGSQGFVEIAVNLGSAAEELKANPGDKVALAFRNHRSLAEVVEQPGS